MTITKRQRRVFRSSNKRKNGVSGDCPKEMKCLARAKSKKELVGER